MISLLKIPNTIAIEALMDENRAYIKEHKDNFEADAKTLILSERSIKDIEYYHIYRDNIKVGFLTGFPQDDYWVAMRVWLKGRKKIYFREVIDTIIELKYQQGYKGLIAHPDKYTASLYTKHNIMKEIK